MDFRPKLLFFSHIGSPEAITGAEKLLLSTVIEMSVFADCVLIVPEEGILSGRASAAGIPVQVTGHIPIYYSMYQGLASVHDEVMQGTRSEGMERLYGLLIQHRPHAVWVNTCVHPLPAIAAKRLGIPVVWCLTETLRISAGTSQAVSLIEEYADRVIGISASTLSPLRIPSLIGKSEIVYPAVDTNRIEPWTWDSRRSSRRGQLRLHENSCLIGFIASHLYENKGLEHFIKMAGIVGAARPEAVFAVTGKPVDRAYYERCHRMAQANGMGSRFHWMPFEPDITNVYPALDVLVVPSIIEEGFGMTALEGLLFGKVVVAYASGGLAEIMHATGNTDWLVPMHDCSGLAERVIRLSANVPLRQEISARNQVTAHNEFGSAAYRQRLMASLEQLQLRHEPQPRIVRGSSMERYELRGWRLRPFRSREALVAAGWSGAPEQELPDGTLALLPRGEPIGETPKPERELRAKPERGARAKPERGARAKPERGARAKPERGARAKPERGARAKPGRGARAKPERGARAKPERGARAKPERGARAKPERGARAKPERGARAKTGQERSLRGKSGAAAKGATASKGGTGGKGRAAAKRRPTVKGDRLQRS
ncbi:Glycosyltransferase involved in cell wall bisynthesis [Paenibacillaceae bacterium GAS479]|nr:Glycosyltransferase involved in cell wall bisynthesis [Paenibacillaceae bacterium GAS479]